ncbi:MAG: germination protein YpeB [Clostridia bacterium]|nr:germination protein YpeB [Clostridia bacterium]
MLRDASGRLVMTKGWKTFFIISAIVMLVAITLLSIFLGIAKANEDKWKANSEYNYENAYYTLTDSLLNMENNLSKLRVTRSENLVNEMLIDVAMNSQTAVANLTTLSYGGYDLSSAIKYCNQVGDYSKYLAQKLNAGGELSEEDRNTLDGLYQATFKLGKSLGSVKESLVSGGKIVDGLGKLNGDFVAIASGLVDGSIEYPALIYDGAFSDSLTDKEVKGLKGEDIDSKGQEDRIKKILSDYDVKGVNFIGENSNGFDSYLYQVNLAGGKVASVQIAKKGGSIVMWDTSFDSVEPTLTIEEGTLLAEQYIAKQGIEKMKGVYATVSDGLLYVNMCYTENDIIYYPDMIKVKVSLDDGKIVGFEGLNYIHNHTQRQLGAPTVTEGEVRNMDFGGLAVKSIRLALIPLSNGKELLTYEVFGNIDEYNFYIFVDAKTGKEVKVMQVIDSDEGELLM